MSHSRNTVLLLFIISALLLLILYVPTSLGLEEKQEILNVNGLPNTYLPILINSRAPTLVSVDSNGTPGNAASSYPSISDDGRFIAFESEADNLVDNDTNQVKDVFVHDRLTRETTRVSVASDGTQGNGGSFEPSISGDGRFVAFTSAANNLVNADSNIDWDIFVHDRLTGETARVSVASDGSQSNDRSSDPSISDDGRFVAFTSDAYNLVNADSPFRDIFVHDRQTGETTLASVASDGSLANSDSTYPSISGDGRFVSFNSLGLCCMNQNV